jgi:hypothetical protein
MAGTSRRVANLNWIEVVVVACLIEQAELLSNANINSLRHFVIVHSSNGIYEKQTYNLSKESVRCVVARQYEDDGRQRFVMFFLRGKNIVVEDVFLVVAHATVSCCKK